MVRTTIDLGCIIKKSPTAEGAVGGNYNPSGNYLLEVMGRRGVQKSRSSGSRRRDAPSRID